MILHRGSRKGLNRLRNATRTMIEQLEKRQLLTTIHGGESLEFVDAAGITDRVVVDGPSTATFELIGATELSDPGAPTTRLPSSTTSRRPSPRQTARRSGSWAAPAAAKGVDLIQVITGARNPTPIFASIQTRTFPPRCL